MTPLLFRGNVLSNVVQGTRFVDFPISILNNSMNICFMPRLKTVPLAEASRAFYHLYLVASAAARAVICIGLRCEGLMTVAALLRCR